MLRNPMQVTLRLHVHVLRILHAGRIDLLPALLVSSVLALYLSSDVAIIKAAKTRIGTKLSSPSMLKELV